jgi:hypothetical protein
MKRTASLRDELETAGLCYRAVQGIYKGVSEVSFCVADTHAPQLKAFILHSAAVFGQDCVLYKDSQGMAWFLYPDGRELLQGKLVSREKETALRQDGCTYDPSNNTYWVIEPLR